MKKLLGDKNCQFVAHSPHSPWKTGKAERGVGLFKEALRRTLKSEELITRENITYLFSRIERELNDRPISNYDSIHSNIVISPANLVFGTTSTVQLVEEDTNTDPLFSKYSTVLKKLSLFRQLFLDIMLPKLLKFNNDNKERRKLSSGDLVLILDRVQANNLHAKGIVKEVQEHNVKVELLHKLKIDKNLQIVKKKTIELVRSPQSLVLLLKAGESYDTFFFAKFDNFEIRNKPKKKNERWIVNSSLQN